MPERPQQLVHLEYLGDASEFAAKMQALIPRCNLLENFSSAEVQGLAHFMHAYRAETGVEIIREGDGGDFMLMLIEGRQDLETGKALRFGQSITDGCLGWDDSRAALEALAEAVKRRRAGVPA